MNKTEMICINCPLGCGMEVEYDDDRNVTKVEGNSCKLGERYAIKEIKDPRRIVCSTVVIDSDIRPRLSVKTEEDVPKNKIFDVMDEINEVHVKAPIKMGQVIIEDVAGTGVDIVATTTLEH